MGSPFASRTVATLPIPFDPPHEVTLQKLAGRHLQKAELAAQANFVESVESRGGFEAQKKLLRMYESDKPADKASAPEPAEAPKKVDPLAGLDPYTVCRFGIKSWTYEESLAEETVDYSEKPRVKAIDDMGPDELEWFATEVMRLTRPRLFQTKDEHQESEKNDSAPSLTH